MYNIVNNEFNMKKFTKGFTLIELLIVIALLGILAVGLLAALDPFEQLKKGTDTSTQSKVSELQGAIIRYYGIRSHMPWCPTGTSCPTDPSGADMTTAPMDTAITNIVAAGELKSDFIVLAGGDTANVFTTGSEANATVSVCYKPTSKSFASNANTKYSKTGVTPNGNCPTGNPADACYWCVE